MAMAEKYGASSNIANQNNKGSSLNMMRNDSDLNLSKNGPITSNIPANAKGLKYNSLDRGSGVIGEHMELGMSPPDRRKKANIHLQPMEHKKAALVQHPVF